MRVLRQSGIWKRTAVWSALLATLLHVALLSLHVTASFERAVADPGDTANAGIHAFCSPGLSTQLSEDGSDQPDRARSTCPVCTGSSLAACLTPPESILAPVVFTVAIAAAPTATTVPAARLHHTAGTIRGPPTSA